MSAFVGYLFSRKRIPGFGFLPMARQCHSAIDEFYCSSIITCGVVDSDVSSVGITLPIPGNDDSYACINFYSFLISKYVIQYKLRFINKFKLISDGKLDNKLFYFFYLRRKKAYYKEPVSRNYLLKKNFLTNSILVT